MPEGVYEATMDEVRERFGTTGHRRALLAGLEQAVKDLKAAGCKRLYLDGGFVTEKTRPRDFDACWEIAGVDPDRLRPLLRDVSVNGRKRQKSVYKGELLPAEAAAAPDGTRYLEFFQRDRDGNRKGIIALNVEDA